MHALLQLDPDVPQSMSSLAGAWKCDASNVTWLVDRLEEHGLAERRAHPGDRRIRTVALTRKGAKIRSQVEARMYEAPEILRPLGPRDLDALSKILRKIAPEDRVPSVVPHFFTDHEHAVVAAAADRLIPPLDEHPGGAALGVADYVDQLLAAFTFDPPLIFAGGPFSGRFGGEAGFAQFMPLSRLEEIAWRHAHRGFARNLRARSQRSDARLAGRSTATASPRSGADFGAVDGRRAGSPPERTARVARRALRPRVRRRVRRARVRRQPRSRGLARRSVGKATCNRAATPTTRSAVVPEPRDCDAVIVGTGPAGATAADVLTSAGWSVVMLEKGRNHLLSLEAPFEGLGHVSNDEIKSARRYFLGPDPFLEPRTYRRDEADGDRLFAGEVNNLPSTVGGGGFHADGKLPRFRAVDFKAHSELGPIEGADIVDWPVSYDEMEPYYAEAEKLIGVAGDADGEPFRGMAQRAVSDAARRRHVRRGAHRPRPRPASATTPTARRRA